MISPISQSTEILIAIELWCKSRRGGQPTAGDRLVASAFGVYAVDLVAAGRFDRMVAWQNQRVVDVPLAVAMARPHCVDLDGALVRTARGLGIYLGDG